MAGLNRIISPILVTAVDCVVQMAAHRKSSRTAFTRQSIGMSMFGVNSSGGQVVRRHLERHGYEVAVFHSNGTGGRVMEDLVGTGAFAGVVDWSITELMDGVAGGIASAGPLRLRAAGAAAIPQVVVPGAVDVVNFGERDSVPPDAGGDRILYEHAPGSTLMRSSVEENRQLGVIVGEKLNAAKGPVSVVIPLGGFSYLDAPGRPFWDPAADSAFLESLASTLSPKIRWVDLDANINDTDFATLVAEEFLRLFAQDEASHEG
jgi:uncharacterized protein (UPF0261 family)